MNNHNSEKLIVALDFPGFEESKEMVQTLGEEISFYKIGLEMMMSGDFFKMIDFLKQNNKKVFADLKLYDIPETVARSIKRLSAFDIDYLTIHSANKEIMKRAAEEKGKMKILGVTVLTCLEQKDLYDMGFDRNLSLEDLVLKKAELCLQSGLDGVVASGFETKLLRQKLGSDFKIVTPGIRLENDKNDDQKRVFDVTSAIESGSSNLVVGRPITRSQNPREAAAKFLSMI